MCKTRNQFYGITKVMDGQALEANLQRLHARLHQMLDRPRRYDGPRGEGSRQSSGEFGLERNVMHTLVHTWSPTRSAPRRLSHPALGRG
jgi:hypothetical protein